MNQYGQNIIVYTPSRELRGRARAALKDNWTTAAIASFIYLAILHVPSAVLNVMFPDGGASNLYMLLVTGAFNYGYSLFLICLFRKEKADYTQLFDGFERVRKTIGLYLYITIFVALWSLLFVIPGIIAAYRYSQSFYILIDNPDMRVKDIVNESKRMMRSNVFKIFCLDLSFIGWDLLASLPSAIAGGIMGATMTINLSNSGMLDAMIESGDFGLGIAAMQTLYGTGTLFMFEILSLLLSLGYIFLTPYREMAHIVMYDIMKGRPNQVQTQI